MMIPPAKLFSVVKNLTRDTSLLPNVLLVRNSRGVVSRSTSSYRCATFQSPESCDGINA